MIVPAITLLNQSLTWWAIDTVVALLVGLVFALIHWDFARSVRWIDEDVAYWWRVQERQPMPTPADYEEALRAAMTITVSRYTERLANLIEDRLATALPEQHLFLPDPLPVERPRLEVVT